MKIRDKFTLSGIYLFFFPFLVLLLAFIGVGAVLTLTGENLVFPYQKAVTIAIVLPLIVCLSIYVTPLEFLLEENSFSIKFLLRTRNIPFSEIISVHYIQSDFKTSWWRKIRLLLYGVQGIHFNKDGYIDYYYVGSDDKTPVRIMLKNKRSYIITFSSPDFYEELQRRHS